MLMLLSRFMLHAIEGFSLDDSLPLLESGT